MEAAGKEEEMVEEEVEEGRSKTERVTIAVKMSFVKHQILSTRPG